MSEDDIRIVIVTTPNEETAEVLAREMVEERLAACGNVIRGVTSLYWWEEEVQRDQEALVVLKTSRDCVAGLQERVLDLHPYEVPEFMVLRADHAYDAYARWIFDETRPPSD